MSTSTAFFYLSNQCCADEWIATFSSTYDPARLGFYWTEQPEQADIIVVQAAINPQFEKKIKDVLRHAASPVVWVALGTCAISCGIFDKNKVTPLAAIVPVDVFIPGCPARPESILNGLLLAQKVLQKKLFLPQSMGENSP